jgi:hypothetical protein
MAFQASDLTIFSTASPSAFFCSAVMPGGAITERQLASTRSMPCSLKVGISTPGMRFSEVTPSARNLPDLIWPSYSLRPEMPAVTLPPRMAASDSPPPENGM